MFRIEYITLYDVSFEAEASVPSRSVKAGAVVGYRGWRNTSECLKACSVESNGVIFCNDFRIFWHIERMSFSSFEEEFGTLSFFFKIK